MEWWEANGQMRQADEGGIERPCRPLTPTKSSCAPSEVRGAVDHARQKIPRKIASERLAILAA